MVLTLKQADVLKKEFDRHNGFIKNGVLFYDARLIAETIDRFTTLEIEKLHANVCTNNNTVLINLSVKEACKRANISAGTFYKILKLGVGPKIMKIGRRTLISSKSFEEWIKNNEL